MMRINKLDNWAWWTYAAIVEQEVVVTLREKYKILEKILD